MNIYIHVYRYRYIYTHAHIDAYIDVTLFKFLTISYYSM